MDFYSRFKAVNTELKVGLTTFKKLKPFFVKKLKDFNTCCCKYHQQMLQIKIGFNNLRSSSSHNGDNHSSCECFCDVVCSNPVEHSTSSIGSVTCQANLHVYKGITHLAEASLCPKPTGSSWHKLSCLKSECPKCGFNIIPLCDKELDPSSDKLVSWCRFEKMAAGKTKFGEQREVTRLEYKVTSPRQFLAYAKPRILEFVLHNFVAQWQNKMYKTKCISLWLEQSSQGQI